MLDDITIGNYQIVAANIANAYIPYYRDVSTAYPDITEGIGKVAREQQVKLARILGLLGRAMGRGVTSITKKELEELNELIEEVKEVHKQVSAWVKEGVLFSKDSEKAVKGLSISPEDIRVVSDVKKKRDKLRGKVSFALRHPFFGAMLGGLGYKGISVGRGALSALSGVLGPLEPLAGPLLGIAGGLGYGFYKGIKGIRRTDEGVKGALPFEDVTKGVVPPIYPKMEAKPLTPLMPTEVGAVPPRSLGAFRARSQRQKEEATEPLFYFFNKRAYKARWTRDVLRALTGKGVRGGVLEEIARGVPTSRTGRIAELLGGLTVWEFGKQLLRKGGKGVAGLFGLGLRYSPEIAFVAGMGTLLREIHSRMKEQEKATKEPVISQWKRYLSFKPFIEGLYTPFVQRLKYGLLGRMYRGLAEKIAPGVEPIPKVLPEKDYLLPNIPYDPGEAPYVPPKRLFKPATNIDDLKSEVMETNKKLDQVVSAIQTMPQQGSASTPVPREAANLRADNEDSFMTMLSLGFFIPELADTR